MGIGDQSDRTVCLHKDERLRVNLSFYGPNSSMPAHDHEIDQISFLLAGELRESVGVDEADLCTFARGLKRSGISHANRFGPHGALILSINLELQERDPFSSSPGWEWQRGDVVRSAMAALNPLARLRDEPNPLCRVQIIWDMMATQVDDEDRPSRVGVSSWLRDVREQLIEEPEANSLADIAGQSGRHPVHLSRAFKTAFGVPPSVYRARCRLARAVSHLLEGQSPAIAASTAGFADQSHFARAVRREMGVTPRHLQSLMAI